MPTRIPTCAAYLLARPEWFHDPDVVSRARLVWMDGFGESIRKSRIGEKRIAGLLSSRRFSGTDDIWAITLGATIYIRSSRAYDPHTPTGLSLLAHELKHVEQYERQGRVAFFARYLVSYWRRGGYSRALALEHEAYALQEKVSIHLMKELDLNVGVPFCLERDAPHTPNMSFVKIKPARA